MFTVTLYQFKKKPNSTAVPGSEAVSRNFTCYALDNSSIIHPTLVLQYGTDDILSYNYAYIPSWGRYYFIGDIAVLEGGIYQLQMDVDALATYRSAILASSQYVLRSASDFDGEIPDDLYPTKADFSAVSANISTVTNPDISASYPNYFNSSFSSGHFVLGVLSGNNSGITYYHLTYAAFSSFLTNMFNTVPGDFTDVSNGIAKALYDPIQYIVSCQWFPIDPNPGWGTIISSINMGGYSVDVTGLNVGRYSSERGIHLSSYVDVPVHPQAVNYPYTKLAPYTEYTLLFEPFGSIPIDPQKVYESGRIVLDWYVDIATGDATLVITDRAGHLITSVTSNIAVNVPVTQLSVDYLGAGLTAISGGAGLIGNILSGNVTGAISSAASGIGNVVSSLVPQVQTKGAPGSFVSYLIGTPAVHAFFRTQVDTNPNRYGRPLCAVMTLSDLTGYAMCSESTIEIEGTAEEADMITGQLNSGVYLE